MGYHISEVHDMKVGAILAASSSFDTQPFSLKGYSKIAAFCQICATGTAKALAAAPASFTVVCGTNQNVSAMSALTSAGLDLGEATANQWHNWEAIRVIAGAGASAEKASTRCLWIDNVSFQIKEAATIADHQLPSSDNRDFINGLVSAIALFCTHLETYDLTTGADSSVEGSICIRRKDFGQGMAQGISAECSLASASTGCWYVEGIKKSGIVEFTPHDITATAASYTHFGVRFKGTGTFPVSVTVIRVADYSVTHINRTVVPNQT